MKIAQTIQAVLMASAAVLSVVALVLGIIGGQS